MHTYLSESMPYESSLDADQNSKLLGKNKAKNFAMRWRIMFKQFKFFALVGCGA